MSGSAKRIKDLQTVFNSPDRYGKGLDWTGYTVHDAANILRRYLNQLPEPIIPLDFYERFRDPLRNHQEQAVGGSEATGQGNDFDHDAAVVTYQRLITELPALNRQLLLYILDLLAVFSSKSELNRMTSANLAAIFQPGIISHPDHDMAPQEYRLSQDVLIFLIENQDNFLIGMTGTAIDEKTSKELQTPPSSTPPLSTPVHKANIGRSASNASAGADTLRRYGGVRRNVSVSSRASRGSGGAPSPISQSTGVPFISQNSSNSVHRSNTVPSKKSPALQSTRFSRPSEPSTPTTPLTSPPPPQTMNEAISPQSLLPSKDAVTMEPSSVMHASIPESPEHRVPRSTTAPLDKRPVLGDIPPGFAPPSAVKTPTKERKISNVFSKSPTLAPTEVESRQPNKLKKKSKVPSANPSAHSSQASLHGDTPATPVFHTPLVSPELASYARADPLAVNRSAFAENATAMPSHRQPQPIHNSPGHNPPEQHTPDRPAGNLRPPRSREPSLHSRSSATDHSDFDALETDPNAQNERKRHRWRFSSSAKKEVPDYSPLAPPPQITENHRARNSASSLGSSKARKSFTGESQNTQAGATDTSSAAPLSSIESEQLKDSSEQTEKKSGLFGRLKQKVEENRERRHQREVEKERAKSPGNDSVAAEPRHSLSAFAHERIPFRSRSIDKSRASGEKLVEAAIPTQGDSTPTMRSTAVLNQAGTTDSAAEIMPAADNNQANEAVRGRANGRP